MIKQRIFELKGFIPIGIMEWWSSGMMGLKEFFTIKMAYLRLRRFINLLNYEIK